MMFMVKKPGEWKKGWTLSKKQLEEYLRLQEQPVSAWQAHAAAADGSARTCLPAARCCGPLTSTLPPPMSINNARLFLRFTACDAAR
jgi:hypothetical protein